MKIKSITGATKARDKKEDIRAPKDREKKEDLGDPQWDNHSNSEINFNDDTDISCKLLQGIARKYNL